MRELVNGFIGVWNSLEWPFTSGETGEMIGAISLMMAATFVLFIAVHVVGAVWDALVRKFCPRPFLFPSTRRPWK